jgi:hypothetical protein
MLFAMALEKTTGGFQLFDKFGALHTVSSAMSLVLEPGWFA